MDPRTRQPQGLTRPLAVGVATVAALAVWAVVEGVFGLDLRSPAASGRASHDIGASNVALAAITAALAGWGLLAALERLTGRARTAWTMIAAAVLGASLGAPLTGDGITAADRVALVALHAVVAAVLIPVLRRTAGSPHTSRKAASERPTVPER